MKNVKTFDIFNINEESWNNGRESDLPHYSFREEKPKEKVNWFKSMVNDYYTQTNGDNIISIELLKDGTYSFKNFRGEIFIYKDNKFSKL